MKKPPRPSTVIRTLTSTKLASVVGGLPPDPIRQRNHNQTIIVKRTRPPVFRALVEAELRALAKQGRR